MQKTRRRTKIKRDPAVALERGKRLKMCRGIADRTLQQLASAYNISLSCLAKWERGQLSISEKNASKIVNMLVSEGIICSQQWLLHGTGNPPAVSTGSIFFQKDESDLLTPLSEIAPHLALFNEIEFFKRNNRNAIVRTVPDNVMKPIFCEGDFVGGIEIPIDQYQWAHGDFCIVELNAGPFLIRQFFLEKGQIRLRVEAGDDCDSAPLNSTIKRVCPIIYHRKLSKYASDAPADAEHKEV